MSEWRLTLELGLQGLRDEADLDQILERRGWNLRGGRNQVSRRVGWGWEREQARNSLGCSKSGVSRGMCTLDLLALLRSLEFLLWAVESL